MIFRIFYFVLLTLVTIQISSCSSLETSISKKDFTLDLSKKGLTEIPSEVFLRTDLKVLKLYNNNIQSLPPEIGQLIHLEKLYLGKNKLITLPTEISQLKNLKLLSIQFNRLTELPNSIGELEKLEQLILNQNQLKRIPTEIGKLKRLKNLMIDFNWLEELPDELTDCTSLEFISLHRNNLSALPDSLNKLIHLKELTISKAGFLVQLPEGLCDLRMLELLEIDGYSVVPMCLLVNKTNRLRIVVK